MSNALALPKNTVYSTNLQELDETVKAMMETSTNLTPSVKGRKEHAQICKVCGKEGQAGAIKNHIEANHLEGLSVPCKICGKILRSRSSLSMHILRNHKT